MDGDEHLHPLQVGQLHGDLLDLGGHALKQGGWSDLAEAQSLLNFLGVSRRTVVQHTLKELLNREFPLFDGLTLESGDDGLLGKQRRIKFETSSCH